LLRLHSNEAGLDIRHLSRAFIVLSFVAWHRVWASPSSIDQEPLGVGKGRGILECFHVMWLPQHPWSNKIFPGGGAVRTGGLSQHETGYPRRIARHLDLHHLAEVNGIYIHISTTAMTLSNRRTGGTLQSLSSWPRHMSSHTSTGTRFSGRYEASSEAAMSSNSAESLSQIYPRDSGNHASARSCHSSPSMRLSPGDSMTD
jgi:hypothetical protein